MADGLPLWLVDPGVVGVALNVLVVLLSGGVARGHVGGLEVEEAEVQEEGVGEVEQHAGGVVLVNRIIQVNMTSSVK